MRLDGSTSAAAPQLQPGAPSPVGNPLQGGDRRYVLSELLLVNVNATHAYSTLSSPFEIWHPSTRLHATMHIGALADDREDVTIPNTWSWRMDAWGKTSRERFGGRRIKGSEIVPGSCALPVTLPASYEAITGVDQWRGTVTVPSGGTGLAVNCQLIITVSWEPIASAADLSDEELGRLFRTCKVIGGNGATVYNAAS